MSESRARLSAFIRGRLLFRDEEVEHGGELRSDYADVASAGDLDVGDFGAGGFAGCDHLARLRDVDGAVVVAVDYVLRDVTDLRHAGGGAAAGDRAQRGEEIGMRHGDAPRTVPAHGVAHEVDAAGVDAIVALHFGEHVKHVLFGGAAVHGGGIAAFRTGDEEAHAFGFALERAATVLLEHRVLVATHSVQGDQQRCG